MELGFSQNWESCFGFDSSIKNKMLFQFLGSENHSRFGPPFLLNGMGYTK
jgi:hypothetical protein